MIKQFKQRNVTWIDIESPTKDDIANLITTYNLHSLVGNELIAPSHESHVDVYERYLYLVLHFPTCEICYTPNQKEKQDTQELNIILGRDFLITIHYEPLQTLEDFSRIFEAQAKIGDNRTEFHAGYLFHHIMREMYASLEVGMDFVNTDLKRVEKKVFEGKEKEMVVALADINRNLLDFRWALKPHMKILDSLDSVVGDFFDHKFNHYIRSIIGQYNQVWEMLESNREMFKEIKQTNDSLLTIKTNEIMKILTIMAFTTLPLSLFTSIFGMNTINTPIIGSTNDFWIIVTIMLVAVCLMFIFFKNRRWL